MLHRRRRALALLAVTAAPALTIALTGAAVAQDDGTVEGEFREVKD